MGTDAMKVAHLTSVHPRYDTRVFFKECCGLAENGFDVTLVVADGKGDEVLHGVEIIDVGEQKGRVRRMLYGVNDVYRKALELDCDLYHLHDPELVRIGLKLKSKGKKVVFDIHEMVSEQIKSKHYLPVWLRSGIALLYRLYERRNLKKLDALVLAESSYLDYYVRYNGRNAVVQNMPDPDYLAPYATLQRDRNEIFYIGAISNGRGLDVTIEALRLLHRDNIDFKMHYVGAIQDTQLSSLDLEGIEDKVVFYGRLKLDDAYALSMHAKAGLSVLKPVGNYVHSYSTKVFEYMSIGLPVITSDFELYRGVVEKEECGFCIDPTDPRALADAIRFLFEHPEAVVQMGKNGRRAVRETYNWNKEELKLLQLYEQVSRGRV